MGQPGCSAVTAAMAPKAKAAPGQPSPLPQLEEEVQLPDGLEPPPEPPFTCVIAHAVGHSFELEDGEGARTFDPCAQLLQRLRQEREEAAAAGASAGPQEDQPFAHVGREELETIRTSDDAADGSMAKALIRKVQSEVAARRRRRSNAARRRLMETGDAGTVPPDAASHGGAAPELVLLLVGYPTSAEELQELRTEAAFDCANSWITIYFAGVTMMLDEGFVPEATDDGQEVPVPRIPVACELPEVVDALFDAIQGADLGSSLANATIRTIPDSHKLASTPEAEVQRVRNMMLSVCASESGRRAEFVAWVKDTPRLPLPELRPSDTVVYERLADSVDQARLDVPLLLHCLCEQVVCTQGGDADCMEENARLKEEAQREQLRQFEEFMDTTQDLISWDGGLTVGPHSLEPPKEEDHAGMAEGGGSLVPQVDTAACRHLGQKFPGGSSVLEAVHRVLGHLNGPGKDRAGFPATAAMSESARCATRNRFYKYMPRTPIVECERMLLLHEFEKLLHGSQPEREWCLQDRVHHERISAPHLMQSLLAATRSEGFVNTAYMPRHDCLLLAVHHRALKGWMLWHAWMGDLLSPPGALTSSGGEALCTVPTLNDWQQLIVGTGPTPTPPSRFLDIDARELGYCRVLEKILSPADGSVILRTSLQCGLAATFPRPRAASAELGKDEDAQIADDGSEDGEEDAEAVADRAAALAAKPPEPPDSDPAAFREVRSARVVKDDLTFGMIDDLSWAEVRVKLRMIREERERIEAIAKAEQEAAEEEARKAREEQEAARIAQGLPPTDDTEAGEQAEQDGDAADGEEVPNVGSITEVRLEDLKFGKLWVAFQRGARYTVQMHWGRPWYPEGAEAYEPVFAKPGVFSTYVAASGLTVQIFSDGTVWQRLPVQGSGGPVQYNSAKSDGRPCLPGCALDKELVRIVTPYGVLIRELLSGRREIYYPDGVQATRNPLFSELSQRIDERRRMNGEANKRLLQLLQNIANVYGGMHGGLAAGEPLPASDEPVPAVAPSDDAKVHGLPGHWRVSHPTGHVYGRAPVPVAPEKAPEAEIEGDAAQAQPDNVEAEPPVPLSQRLATLLGGTIVDRGETIEYEIQATSSSAAIDPHTGQRAHMTLEGLMMFEDEHGVTKTCILPDRTRVDSSKRQDGVDITIHGAAAAKVTCHTHNELMRPHMKVVVSCGDGTCLEVVPQVIHQETGDLVPTDPLDPSTVSTNASVILRRPDGAVISSRGAGEVEVMSKYDAVQSGTNLGSTVNVSRVYTARVDQSCLSLCDCDENVFEVHGDQTLGCILAVKLGDDAPSPRCKEPGKAYVHPDADYFQLPGRAPDPRLFAIYGDGEAEELLTTREAHDLLRLAREDPDTVLIEGEPMGRPMETCKCHTILRTVSLGPTQVGVPPPADGGLPPSLAGFEDSQAEQPGGPPEHFTEVRQLIEYPAISDAARARFHAAKARHDAEEQEQSARHARFGQEARGKVEMEDVTMLGRSPEAGGGA